MDFLPSKSHWPTIPCVLSCLEATFTVGLDIEAHPPEPHHLVMPSPHAVLLWAESLHTGEANIAWRLL